MTEQTDFRAEMANIEDRIARQQMSAAQVFTQMRQIVNRALSHAEGEPGDSDICERIELPHVLAWADGIRGDMWTEYADRITNEEARVAQAVWAAHTGEQPVSDPDGLPSDWRRVVEGAADMLGESAKQHRGRGDNATAAMCDRFGAMLRDEILSGPAPDERGIARPGYAGVTVWIGGQECTQVVARTDLETSRADELLRLFENARHLLRAGKEGEDHE